MWKKINERDNLIFHVKSKNTCCECGEDLTQKSNPNRNMKATHAFNVTNVVNNSTEVNNLTYI